MLYSELGSCTVTVGFTLRKPLHDTCTCVDVCTCVHVHVFPAGHGTTGTLKVPTKVQNIESVRQVDCGAAHTMCLSMDSVRVWSFGAGELWEAGPRRHQQTAAS